MRVIQGTIPTFGWFQNMLDGVLSYFEVKTLCIHCGCVVLWINYGRRRNKFRCGVGRWCNNDDAAFVVFNDT